MYILISRESFPKKLIQNLYAISDVIIITLQNDDSQQNKMYFYTNIEIALEWE